MAIETNDLKGILILVLFAIPKIASTNINCSGKAFHCVNSTHFMICVDLGGGLSTTIDDFIIPCPATTVCHENNVFECDFPEVTTPPFQVIGVYKQSDTSELTSVTNSVTTPTPTSIFSVFKENNTATTLPIPEEVTPVVKLEVLENIKNPVGVNSGNTTETSFKVTSNFFNNTNKIVNDKQASNNTITTSATDNNKHLEHAVETSIHESVTTSLINTSKSIDTVTSVIGLINLISTDPPSELITMPPSDVLTSLDSNIVHGNIETTTEQYTAKQVIIRKKNVTNKIIIPTGIIITERSIITDEVSTTPVVDTYIENINKTDSNNQTTAEPNSLGKSNSTFVLIPETTTEYSASVKIVNISEPVTVVASPQTTTGNAFVPLGLVDLSSGLNHSVRSTNLSTDYLSIFYNNTAATVNNNISFYKYDINNNSSAELNSTGDITTVEKVSETNPNGFIPEPITVASPQITTEKVLSIATEANIRYNIETAISGALFNNDSTVEKQTIVTQPLEIIITTNSPIELTDSLYQINPELNKSLIINTADSMNTIERINTVYNASSIDMNNNKVSVTLLPPTTLKNLEIEIPTAETLQNGFTAHAIEVKNELPATNAPFSINETNMEIVGTNVLLSVSTTPAYDNATLEPVAITPVKDFISQSAVSVSTSFTPEIIVLNVSDGKTSLDQRTTQKVITEQDVKISGFLNQTGNLVTVLSQENSNAEQRTQTVQDLVGMTTTYWNNYENSTTALFPSDATEKTSLSDIIKTMKQDNISATSVVNTQDIFSKIILRPKPPSNHVTEVSSTMPETVHIPSKASANIFEQAATNTPNIDTLQHYKIETTTTIPVDVTTTTVRKDVTINVENVTNIPITTLPQQDLLNQKNNIVRQLNATTTATETISDFVSSTVTTSGYVLNTKNINLKISNQTDSVNVKNKISNINKTETINPINGEHSVNATSFSSTKKTNMDESIKIVSVLDIINSSVNAMPIGTLQSTSSKSLLSNDYIKTTKSQDSSIYVTATDNVPDYHLVQAGESITQKNPEPIVSLGETKVMNSVSSTSSAYTLPIIEINTEKVQYVSTEAPIPGTVELKLKKIAVDYVTEKTNDNIFSTEPTLIQLNKLPKVEAESFVSNYTPGSIVNNNNPQSMPSLPIAGVTAAQMTTEPIHKNNVFAETTPLSTTGKTYQEVLPRIKTTDFPQYVTTTKVTYNNPQSISNITTETITDSLTVPDSMVETIKVIEDKVSGTYFGDIISSDIMSNNRTVNNANYSVKSVKNVIDHESIVVGTTPKNNVQNKKSVDMDKAEIVNHTESNWMRSDVNIDSVKIKEGSIEDENSESSVLKSGTDVQNKTLVSDSSIMSKIKLKDGISASKIEYRRTTVATNHKEAGPGAPKNATQSIAMITKENKSTEIDSSVNTKLEIQVQVVSKNISDSFNINNTKTNITASHHNLSLQNSTIYDELEQHLISTNHTITTEVQSHLNEGDKHSNKTSDALIFNLTSMHNPNLTSIKLNASSKYYHAVTIFNCADHIRGKYADNKDCRKFYTCVGNLHPILGTCPNNTVFSEINKQCTRNLSHCVRNNQFRCLFEGRFSDFFKNKIYYICVKNRTLGFIRYKLQCQDDYHLNKDSVKCEKNEDISIQSASSVSEINNDESKPKPKLEKIISIDDFECEDEGKFPYAKDCSKYYVCTKTKNVYRRKINKCANDEVFDKKKKKCIESDSGEC